MLKVHARVDGVSKLWDWPLGWLGPLFVIFVPPSVALADSFGTGNRLGGNRQLQLEEKGTLRNEFFDFLLLWFLAANSPL